MKTKRTAKTAAEPETIKAPDGMRVAQQMRMAWIESVAIANGSNGICRKDICAAWGITPTQASGDIKEYIRCTGNDGRLQYDGSAARYVWHGTDATQLMDRSAIAPLCRRIIDPPAPRE